MKIDAGADFIDRTKVAQRLLYIRLRDEAKLPKLKVQPGHDHILGCVSPLALFSPLISLFFSSLFFFVSLSLFHLCLLYLSLPPVSLSLLRLFSVSDF